MRQRVCTFYSGVVEDKGKTNWADLATLGVTMVFCAIHCVAWSFEFPSHTERLLWQICTTVIMCGPLEGVLGIGINVAWDKWIRGSLPVWVENQVIGGVVLPLSKFLVFLFIIIYIVA
jgi:hypothetical protein